MKIYCFDLDGTLCNTINSEYETSEPYYHRIDIVNKLFLQGNVIKIYTARGMGRNNDESDRASAMFENMTRNQLLIWGVKYHELFFGKPSADFYIDDKNLNLDQFFGV
jgi:hypothetical protein